MKARLRFHSVGHLGDSPPVLLPASSFAETSLAAAVDDKVATVPDPPATPSGA